MKIGYIGLGALGSCLARRFLSDHTLIVWDINPAAVAALERDGAQPARTAADVGRQADVTLVCLPRSSDVETLLFSPSGLFEGLAPDKLLIDQTSGNPAETARMATRLAAAGIEMVDAPVSGSPQVIPTGGATLMVSGSDAVFERALPILKTITDKVHRAGTRVGDGQAMKMLNNSMNSICRLGTLEVVAMGRKLGLPLEVMRDVFRTSSARNLTTERMLPALVEGKSSTNFAMTLMLKDIGQAVQLGGGLGVPMPMTTLLRSLMQTGLALCGPRASMEDLAVLAARMADISIVTHAHETLPDGSAGEAGTVAKVGSVSILGVTLDDRAIGQLSSCGWTVGFTTPAGAAVPLNDTDRERIRASELILIGDEGSTSLADRLFGEGLGAALGPDHVVVDMGRTGPKDVARMAARLAEQGSARLVDMRSCSAPGLPAARTIACGSDPDVFSRVRSLAAVFGDHVVLCGSPGTAATVGLLNSAATALCYVASQECLTVGRTYGLQWQHMTSILFGSSGWSAALQSILIIGPDPEPAASGDLASLSRDLSAWSDLSLDSQAPAFLASAGRAAVEQASVLAGPAAGLDAVRFIFEPMRDVRSADI